MDPIYHLAVDGEWNPHDEEYLPSTFDQDGFIHCSTADQLADTARRHFGSRHDLILLMIDPSDLGDLVVFEDLSGQGEPYPHIYSPLPVRAVSEARRWQPDG